MLPILNSPEPNRPSGEPSYKMASANNKRRCEDPGNLTTTGKQPKVRRLQKFKDEYIVAYPVLRRSELGDLHAYCTVCRSNFTVSHWGMNDCAVHVNGLRHIKYAKAKEKQPTMMDMLKDGSDKQSELNHSVMKSELILKFLS